METQTPKQPLCKKNKLANQSKSSSFLEELKKQLYQAGIKRMVSLILRPGTWHWAMETLPSCAEKVELWIEKLITFFSN